MKKNLFVFSLFVVGLLSFSHIQAQVVVNDPTMLSESLRNWEQQLQQANKQYEKINEQSKLLQESIDKYKIVNATIKNSIKVKNLIDKQVRIVSFLSNEMNRTPSNIVNVKAYETYMQRMQALIEISKQNITELTELLTDGTLSLSDYERLQLIDNMDSRSSNLLNRAQLERQKYEKLNAQLSELNRLRNN